MTNRYFSVLILLFFCLFSLSDSYPDSNQKKPTIAVLKFKNESQTERLDFFETGLPQMIITDLAGISSINVVERERVDQFLSEVNISETVLMDDVTVQKAGKALGADYLLKGTFKEKIVSGKPLNESVLTVSVEIFDVSANKLVKQVMVQGKSGEFFKLEKDIVRNVIEELNILVTEKEKANVQQIDTRSLEAQLHYLRGAKLFRISSSEGEEAIEEARKEFKQAIYLDPNFELAYYRLARTNDPSTGGTDKYHVRVKKEIEDYEQLIKKFPKSKYMVDYLYTLAFASYRTQWYRVDREHYLKKAIWALTKRLEDHPGENPMLPSWDFQLSSSIWVWDNSLKGCARMLEACYYQIGNAQKAREVHEMWLGTYGFDDMVKYYTTKKGYDKVIELYQKKIDRNKDGDPFIAYEALYKIGEIYYDKLKDIKKARATFEKALTYLPQEETAFRDGDKVKWPRADQLFERLTGCIQKESYDGVESMKRVELGLRAIDFYLSRNAPKWEKERSIKKSFYQIMDTYYRRKDIDGATITYEEVKKLVASENIGHLGRGENLLKDWLVKAGRVKKDKTWIVYGPQEETNFFRMRYRPTAIAVGESDVYFGLGRGYEIHDPAQRRPRMFYGCVLGRYLKADDRWEMIPIPDKDFYDFAISQMLLIDAEIWLTCYPRGVARYNTSSETWSFITTREGLPSNSVHCLAYVNDGLWFGFGEMDKSNRTCDKPGGIFRIDKAENIIPYVDAKATKYPVTALAADSDVLWVGTSNGTISQFDTMTQKWKVMKKVLGGVRQIAVGRDNVWFACVWDGLYRYNRTDGKWYHYKHEHGEWKEEDISPLVRYYSHFDYVNCVTACGNRLWVGIYPGLHSRGHSGIDMLDVESGKWQPLGRKVRSTFDIAIDGNELWVASSKIMRCGAFKPVSQITREGKIANYYSRIRTFHKQRRDKEAVSLIIEIWNDKHLGESRKRDIILMLKEMDPKHSVKILLLESRTKGGKRVRFLVEHDELWRPLHSELEDTLSRALQSRDSIVRKKAAQILLYVGREDPVVP